MSKDGHLKKKSRHNKKRYRNLKKMDKVQVAEQACSVVSKSQEAKRLTNATGKVSEGKQEPESRLLFPKCLRD